MSFTLIIIIITVAISAYSFQNNDIYSKLILWPKRMDSPAEYYRLLTSGFIHADWTHLIFNMLTLFFFGQNVEMALGNGYLFLILYLAGVVIASLPSFIKNRNNSYYRSLGASGGVAAVLFAAIYYLPWRIIYFWIIPIPGIIAGIAYLVYSAYMSRRGGDAINHDAHFWGAMFGFLFMLIIDSSHGQSFLVKLMHPTFF